VDPVALSSFGVAIIAMVAVVVVAGVAMALPFVAFVRDRERFEAIVAKLRIGGAGTPDTPAPPPPKQLPPAVTRRSRADDADRWGPVVPDSSPGHDGPTSVRFPTTPATPQPTPPWARDTARAVWGDHQDELPDPPYVKDPDKPGEITSQFEPIRVASDAELNRWGSADWLSTVPDQPKEGTVVPFEGRRPRRPRRRRTTPPPPVEDEEGGDAS
jgi:hypothetical protein